MITLKAMLKPVHLGLHVKAVVQQTLAIVIAMAVAKPKLRVAAKALKRKIAE